jgi:hypothetical protein
MCGSLLATMGASFSLGRATLRATGEDAIAMLG